MNTKQLILETTLKLMIENQDSIISIRQISNASGITIGGIYHYFSNKEEIYNEITEKYYINFYKFDFDRLRQTRKCKGENLRCHCRDFQAKGNRNRNRIVR